jgi:hypothetical protein
MLGQQARHRWYWAALMGVLYAAVGILAWQRTLIPDEIRPLMVARGPLQDLLAYARLDLVQTPLSYMAQYAWLNLWGHSDGAAKAFALLVGMATLVWFTHTAARFTPHWRMASFLLLAIYLRVGSAPNLVRMYGLLVLVAVATLHLWDVWRRRPTTGRLAAWAAAMALLFWTHGSGLLLLSGFVVATWFFGPAGRKERLAFLVAATMSVLSLAPWIVFVAATFEERGIAANVQAIPGNPTVILGRLPFQLLSGIDPGGGSLRLPLERAWFTPALQWLAILVHAGLLASAASVLRRPRDARKDGTDSISAWWLLAVCGTPVLLLYLFSVSVVHALHPRYLTLLFPVYCLLLAHLGGAGGRAGRVLLAGVLLPWLLVSSGLTVAQHLSRPTLGQGTEVVARERTDRDLVICDRWGPLGYRVVWDWTRRLHREDQITVIGAAGLSWLRPYFPGQDLDGLGVADIDRVWLFHSESDAADQVGRVLRERGFRPGRVVADGWYHLALYER